MSNEPASNSRLELPKLTPTSRSTSSMLMSDQLSSDMGTEDKRMSLSVNYLPSKFPATLLSEGPKRRKVWRNSDSPLRKRGGGREAFRRNEPRMPGDDDEDLDGVEFSSHLKPKQRWNRFKWTLVAANLIVRAVPSYHDVISDSSCRTNENNR